MRYYDRSFLLLLGITTVSSFILGSSVQALVRTIDSNKSSAARGKRYSFQRPQPRIPSFIRQSSQSPPFPNGGNEKKKKTVQQQTSASFISRLKGFSLSSSDSKKALTAIIVVALGYIATYTSLFRYSGLFLQNTLFHSYQNLLINHPLPTKTLTGAVLAIVGDALAQATTQTGQQQNSFASYYDRRRALSFALFDMCYRVFQHNMFPVIIGSCQGNVLKKVLPRILPSKNLVALLLPAAAAVEQTAIYQFVIVPCLYYPAFFAFTGLILGLTSRESLDRMKSQFFLCWRRNLMFWIPTQLFLFGVVDETFQIPFACVMGMIWSSILSLTAGKTSHSKQSK